ncbi:MAG: hypothetical protein ACTHU0_10260 [Kofleriaceae bacterium]
MAFDLTTVFLDRGSSNAPAFAMFGGQLVMAWQSSTQSLLLSTYTPARGWSTPTTPPELAGQPPDSGGPALAVYEGKLWMVWLSQSSLYVATQSEAGAWTVSAVSGIPAASGTPALAACRDRLYLAYTTPGSSGHLAHPTVLWFTPEGGATPTVPQTATIGQFSLSGSPSLAAIGGELSMMWQGIAPSTGTVFQSTTTDGTTWSAETAAMTDDATGTPSVVAFGNTLYATVPQASGAIALGTATAGSTTTWTIGTTGVTTAQNAASLGVYTDATTATLFLAWPTSGGGLAYATLDGALPDQPQFTAPAQLLTGAGSGAAIARAPNGTLCAAWCSSSGTLQWASQDLTGAWTVSDLPFTTSRNATPALVYWQDQWFLFWITSVATAQYAVSWATCQTGTWTAGSPAFPTANPTESVNAVVFDGQLWVSWADLSHVLNVRYVTGTWSNSGVTWTGPTSLEAASTGTPQLAALGGTLYAVWKGSIQDNQVYWGWFEEGGTSFIVSQQPISTESTAYTPALAAYGDAMYLVDSTSTGLTCAVFRDGNWSTNAPIPGSSPASALVGPVIQLALGSDSTLVMSALQATDATLVTSQLSASVVVNATLTQDFVIAAGPAAGLGVGRVIALSPSGGEIAALLTGNAARILAPDPDSDTGLANTTLALTGPAATATVLADGTQIAFAPSGQGFAFATCAPGGSWSTPTTVSASGTVGAVAARVLGGQLAVAVLVQNGASWSAYVTANWDPANPALGTLLQTVTTTRIDVGTYNASSALIGYAGSAISVWPFDNPAETQSIDCGGIITGAAVAEGPSGETQVLVRFHGSLQLVAPLANGATMLPHHGEQQLAREEFRDLALSFDAASTAHAFSIGRSEHQPRTVYHWAQPSGGAWQDALPITDQATSVMAVSAVRDADGCVHLVTRDNNGGMVHVWQGSSGDWSTEPLAVQSGGAVQPTYSYALEARLVGADGHPLAFAPVALTTRAPCAMRVNGHAAVADAGAPIAAITDAIGRVKIVQPALGLSTEPVVLSAAGLAAPVLLVPNADVEAQLRGISLSGVLDAKAAGRPLVPGTHGQRERRAEALVPLTRDLLMLLPEAAAGAATSTRTRAGLRYRARPITAPARPAPKFACYADLRDPDAPRYQRIAPADAPGLIAELVGGADGWADLASTLGDVWQAIKSGAAELVGLVVTATEQVTATLSLLVDGVKYQFSTAVAGVEQALDLIEAAWGRVQVLLDDLFEWLGRIFDWDNILRLQQAVSWTLQQMIELPRIATQGLVDKIDHGLREIRAQATEQLDAFAADFGTSTIGSITDSVGQAAPELELEMSNHLVLEALFEQVKNGTIGSPKGDPVDTDALQKALDKLESFTRDRTNNDEFSALDAALEPFRTDASTILQLGGQTLISALSAFVQLLFEGMGHALHAMFDVIDQLFAAFEAQLSAVWSIPYVSDVYAYVTQSEAFPDGQPMTLAGVIGLLVAIPANALYTATLDRAPFPTQASVDEFQAELTAAKLAAAAGLTSTADGAGLALPKEVNDILAICYAVVTWMYGAIEGVLDATMPMKKKEGPAPTVIEKGLGWLDTAVGLLVVGFGTPISSFARDPGKLKNLEIWNWVLGLVAPLINMVSLAVSGRLARFVNAITGTLYSLCGAVPCWLLGLYIMLVTKNRNENDPRTNWQNFLGPTASVLKCTLATKLPAVRAVVVALDLVCWVGVGAISYSRVKFPAAQAPELAAAPA